MSYLDTPPTIPDDEKADGLFTQPKDASALINDLYQLSASITKGDEAARNKALNLARQLTSTLTQPIDKAMEIVFTPFISSAVQTSVRMQLFDVLVKHQGPVSTSELAQICKAEELLTGRILRLLASVDFVTELGPDSWIANGTTQAMVIPAIAAGHRFVWDIQVESTIRSPQYLEESGFACPTDPKNGFIQSGLRTRYDVFEYMAKVRPDRLRDFHLFMGNTMGSSSYWFDWYPVEQQILSEYDNSTPLLVDVGGGKGHDIISFANKFPDATGQLILQDIEPALATIAKSDRDSRIRYQPQDFFESNQVTGAKVYFLHHILHDWSEEPSLQILKIVKEAMTPGYSKLLIHDLVLPDTRATKYQSSYDMVMMTFNAGIERSRSQWASLLEKAGLRLENIWHGPGGEDADGIVQAVVDDHS